MKSMLGALLIALTAMLVFVGAGYTHSGGLDSKGGHYNRKTGEYHYHRGGAQAADTKVETPKNTQQKTKSTKPRSVKNKK